MGSSQTRRVDVRTFHCLLFSKRNSPPVLALIMACDEARAREFALRELREANAAKVELREGGRRLWVKRTRRSRAWPWLTRSPVAAPAAESTVGRWENR